MGVGGDFRWGLVGGVGKTITQGLMSLTPISDSTGTAFVIEPVSVETSPVPDRAILNVFYTEGGDLDVNGETRTMSGHKIMVTPLSQGARVMTDAVPVGPREIRSVEVILVKDTHRLKFEFNEQ